MADRTTVRSTARMFAALKVRLLYNQLRFKPWRAVYVVVTALTFTLLGTVGVFGAVTLRLVDDDDAGAVVVVLGAALIVVWAVLPLVLISDDDTLDPARFALLPLGRRRLAVGLITASAVGFAPAATLAVSLATIGTWARGVVPVVTAVLAALLGAATCLVAARASTAAAAAALSGRRGREATLVVIVLVSTSLGLTGPLLTFLATAVGREGLAMVVSGLAWTPLGAAWGAPWAAAQGREWVALARLGIAAVTLVGLWAGYEWALQRRVRPSGGAGRSPRTTSDGPAPGLRAPLVGWLLPDRPLGVLTTRCLLYWHRDPRYALNFAALPIICVVLLVLSWSVQGFGGLALGLGPFVAWVLGLTMVNELAFDGTALWTTVAAGVPGRTERLARTLAVLLWGLPLTGLATLGGVATAGRWDLAAPLLGAAVALLLIGVAVSAVSSVVWTYPVPEAGANPFAGSTGGSTVSLLQQAAAGLAIGLLALPVAGLFIASWWNAVLGWLLAVVAPAYGTLLVRFAVTFGGRRFDSRAPELLAALRT